jgi:hypothetical protein
MPASHSGIDPRKYQENLWNGLICESHLKPLCIDRTVFYAWRWKRPSIWLTVAHRREYG